MRDSVLCVNVVDMACEIIAMDQENSRLRSANAHLTELVHMGNESMNNSIAASRRLMGDVLIAVMDKDSAISIGFEAKSKRVAG